MKDSVDGEVIEKLLMPNGEDDTEGKTGGMMESETENGTDNKPSNIIFDGTHTFYLSGAYIWAGLAW